MREPLARRYRATGDKKYYVGPDVAMLSVDALGFRRGAGALKTLLADNGLSDHPLFAQAKGRGIRALSGHIESTDVTNDVNGGPSGVGIATAAGKAAFWDIVGAPMGRPKIVAFEGEFAMCAGHAQELKTQAIALQTGKRLRVFFSDNNAGIDDALIGGVVHSKFEGYRLKDQWTSYGWNVFTIPDGHDYGQILDVLKTMETWDANDRRPMIVLGKTTKGYWPAAAAGKIPGLGDQIVGYPSHPFAFKMNTDYIVALARTYEQKYRVKFADMEKGAVTDTKERLIQFKTNMDVAMSVLECNGLGDWLADRLAELGDMVRDDFPLRIDVKKDPFLDDRLRVANLPEDTQTLSVTNPAGAKKDVKVALFRKAGETAGARRAISEIVKWLNYVTGNRMLTVAADLSESVNLEHGSLWGHYDPEANPSGTRLKAAIQEAGNVSTAIGLVSQNASVDPDQFAGVWAVSGTYGAFTPLMYLPARVWSQQNQDSRFRTGVLHILSAHSGPETAADAHALWHFLPAGLEALPARPGHQPELLGLQRRGGRVLRRGRDRGPRQESRHHHDRSREAGLPRGRSPHLRGHRSQGRRQGPLRHPRFRARPSEARLRRRPGLERDLQSRERAAKARTGRHQREGGLRDQRRALRSAAGVIPACRAAG